MPSQSQHPNPAAAGDLRLEHLKEWLTSLGTVDVSTIHPASSDASFRRYFRLSVTPSRQYELGKTVVAMDAPPERENVPAFVHVAELLRDAGVTVPTIIAQKVDEGFLLLSDLGNTTYLQRLHPNTASHMYSDAIDALIKIQLSSKPHVLPEFDRAFVMREMGLFPEWFVARHMGVQIDDVQRGQLDTVFEEICANVAAQDKVFMHRDFHSRNLMFLGQDNPGILDFQDAVFGPITYDLGSLLRDAYVQWDEEFVHGCVLAYWEKAKASGLAVNQDADAFYRDFEYMALQRHIKILGIFCRLNYRDGKPNYMSDLPTVMSYVRRTASRYPDLTPLLELLDTVESKSGTLMTHTL
jgi:aminoglycoside/choline kinase family phosphotransferase